MRVVTCRILHGRDGKDHGHLPSLIVIQIYVLQKNCGRQKTYVFIFSDFVEKDTCCSRGQKELCRIAKLSVVPVTAPDIL